MTSIRPYMVLIVMAALLLAGCSQQSYIGANQSLVTAQPSLSPETNQTISPAMNQTPSPAINESNNLSGSEATTPTHFIYCVGGTNRNDNVYFAPISSSGIGTWTATTSYPAPSPSSCVSNNGYIYCIGSQNTTYGEESPVYYAPISTSGVGTWTATTPYPMTILSSCVSNNGYVYCIGFSADNLGGIDNVYFAPLSSSGIGTWTATTSSPHPSNCVSYNGYVYCQSGGVYNESQQSFYPAPGYYAPISASGVGNWTATTPHPATPYIDPIPSSCVSDNDSIYCISGQSTGVGGDSYLTPVYYAPISSSGVGNWATTTSYPGPVTPYPAPIHSSCVSDNGYIYCIGGQSTSFEEINQSSSGTLYNTYTTKYYQVYFARLSSSGVGTWTATTPYPFPVSGQGCVIN